jgi:hypothetical protein
MLELSESWKNESHKSVVSRDRERNGNGGPRGEGVRLCGNFGFGELLGGVWRALNITFELQKRQKE